MIFGWQQRDENNNVKINSSRSDILTLLTLLSADVKSTVLLRIPSLTKVELCNFQLLHFPKCFQVPKCFMDNALYLCNIWKGRSWVNANVSVSSIFNNDQFYLRYYFLRQRTPPRKDSAKSQLLRLYSKFSFIKVLKALQVLIFTTFWRNVTRPSQICALLTSTDWTYRDILQRSFSSIFLKCVFISLFFQYRL